MAKRITPTTKRGMHTYSVEGEDVCPDCCWAIPAGRKSCPRCGIQRYWVEHEHDGGADFTVCDPKCMALRPTPMRKGRLGLRHRRLLPGASDDSLPWLRPGLGAVPRRPRGLHSE